MAWGVLVLAGLLEIGWAVGMKYAEGFTRFWPSVATILCLITSLWLLCLAMKSLPLGTAYAVWVGIGAIGTFFMGVSLFGEPLNVVRTLSVGFIFLGIVGLKLSAS